MSRDSRNSRDDSRNHDRFDEITGREYDSHGRDHDNDFVDSGGFDAERVRFKLRGDKVTQVQEYENGRWQTERVEKGEIWTFDGSNLIHQDRGHGGLQTSTYTDSDGDGIFTAIIVNSDSLGL
jgi:hypothetical protein